MKRPLDKKPNYKPKEEPIVEIGFLRSINNKKVFIIDSKGTDTKIIYRDKITYILGNNRK